MHDVPLPADAFTVRTEKAAAAFFVPSALAPPPDGRLSAELDTALAETRQGDADGGVYYFLDQGRPVMRRVAARKGPPALDLWRMAALSEADARELAAAHAASPIRSASPWPHAPLPVPPPTDRLLPSERSPGGILMRVLRHGAALAVLLLCAPAVAQTPVIDPAIQALVGRLDLEKYKATIKGLTKFGDRRQGTDRNRAAIDWIEAQLKSYGCADIERLKYDFQPPPATPAATPAAKVPEGSPLERAVGGGRPRGYRIPTGVNTDPLKQPDAALRKLNEQPTTPGPREEVYCTKVGTTHPGEMYILGAHMDGHGWGEAANDDGSGTALVMELARILSAPEVQTDRSIRFVLWNNEETGLNGARAYVAQREKLQGIESPAGSGKYPEPKWLGMIQHDMMLFDHGAPRADGTMSKEQRPEADVNVEFQMNSKFAAQSQALAWALQTANETYATDYPVTVGAHMTNTDSTPFMDSVAAISVRENERGIHIGSGWDPQWHQPTDVFATYSDKDFRLGLNAAQTTLSAVLKLAGVSLKK